MAQNKKPRKKFTPKPSSAQNALMNIAYKLKNKSLLMGDTQDLLIVTQHLFFIQAASKDMQYKLTSLKYLNSVKNSFKKTLENIESNCVYDENGSPNANANAIVNMHHRTRQKILYFILKIYEPTLSLWSCLTASKMSKLKIEARQQLDYFIFLHCPKVANFLF